MAREFLLGGFKVGTDYPPIFFAEIGSYFNGDFELAKYLVKRIIEARDAVSHQPVVLKTEILNNAEICLLDETEETYTDKNGQIKKENYRTLIERKILPLDSYEKLFRIISDSNMPFVVSVYDFEAAEFAATHGAAALKIASSNIVHIPLIRYAATFKLPLVIDTGRSSLSEVFRAVDTARKAGCYDIIIQHSPDGHPALPEAHNLRLLQTYLQCFDLPVGLSDHHVGLEMLYPSIALGASVLEKGVHLYPEELDQDISHTMALEDLLKALQLTYDCWIALGKGERDLKQKIKGVIGTSQRQCLIAKHDLILGDRINLDTIRFAFPCRGIPVENWDLVEGWKIAEAIPKNSPVTWQHISKSNDT